MESGNIDIARLLQMLMGRDGHGEPEDDSDIPTVLESNDMSGLVKYMQSEQCKNVCVMLGAGVSTSAGIPDFRSPETGLYANLARLDLPFPEAVFSINFFRENPRPFYVLAKELFPGKYRPTITHSFVKLLSDKSLLRKCFTQNIDTLERLAGVPSSEVIEAHGSFASHRCIDCKTPYGDDEMKSAVESDVIPRCHECDGLVKPEIVFFGESLPDSFWQAIPALRDTDLLIVIGTSLVVHPFASLINRVPPDCPRVLINMEPAGDIGELKNDVVLLGKCDQIIQDLAKHLAWDDELQRVWSLTARPSEIDDTEPAAREPNLKSEVDKLADDIGTALKLEEQGASSMPLATVTGQPSLPQLEDTALLSNDVEAELDLRDIHLDPKPDAKLV